MVLVWLFATRRRPKSPHLLRLVVVACGDVLLRGSGFADRLGIKAVNHDDAVVSRPFAIDVETPTCIACAIGRRSTFAKR